MMSEKLETSRLPLSPHLQIWRWQLPMTLSLLHRISGIGLAFGVFMLLWMLMSLAAGEVAYARFYNFSATPLGLFMIFCWSAGLFYHICNGVRHLSWDCGYLLELKNAYRSGYAAMGVGIFLLVMTWFIACPWGHS